jgi:Flp pilus assembly protein TadG
MVEFALVAPVFFVLLFGVIEGGRFVLYYQTLANATREGARYGIVHGWKSYCPSGTMPPGEPTPIACYDQPGNNIVQRVKDSAFGLLGTTVTVVPTWWATDGVTLGNNGRDNTLRVTADYTYRVLLPLPLPPISISAESSLVINN